MYTMLIHHEGNECGVSFPEFAGCVSVAGSRYDAVVQGRYALKLHLECMRDDNDPLPAPSTELVLECISECENPVSTYSLSETLIRSWYDV